MGSTDTKQQESEYTILRRKKLREGVSPVIINCGHPEPELSLCLAGMGVSDTLGYNPEDYRAEFNEHLAECEICAIFHAQDASVILNRKVREKIVSKHN